MNCVRCGSKMDEKDRACLKCGAINYNHPLNASFAKKYGDKAEKENANPELLKNTIGLFPKIVLVLMILAIILILCHLVGLF